MSLVLLKSFVSEITANNAEMKKSTDDITTIKSQILFMNEYIKELKDFDEQQVVADAEAAVIIAGIQDEIISLKAFDVNEEKEEEEIREDIKELVASDVVQVAVDVEAAVIIAGLQAEILALKAANNVQDDGEKIIKKDVGVLQVEVKDLKSNVETEKFDEIANIELMITRLKAELVALNGGEPILNDAEGIAFDSGEIALDLIGA